MKGDPVGFGYFSCGCTLCEINARTMKDPVHTFGGWADHRRHYLESEEEFLKRVPDGIIKWPDDHVDIKQPIILTYMPEDFKY